MIEELEPPEGYVFLCTHCAKDIGIELPDETNPYELADELDRVLQVAGCDNRVPRMLRQQADRIAELEAKVQVKELTDEEIWELAQPHGDLAWQDCTLDFARAILRKAQDKDE